MQKSKHLLIIGFVWPEPKSSAAGNRMMQLIDLFKSNNYKITFACTALNLEFSDDLSVLGIHTEIIKLNSETFDVFLSQLNPNIVLFDRFMVEEQFGWRVSESCPHALKILNTEDLHSLRFGRHQAVKENRKFEVEELMTSDITKREIASLYRCDISLFVSEFEMEILKNLFKIPENLIYYLPIFAEIFNYLPEFEERKDFIFIGNFLHEPNWNAVQFLSEIIFPLIRLQLPEVKLLVYGAYSSQKVLQLHQPKKHFHIMGRAENAHDVVKKSKIILAPIRFGAGIKGKLLEAMQCGTPSITTSIGAEAMNGNLDWNGFIEDNPNEFANKAVALYNDNNLWVKAQKNGFEILEKRFLKSNYETVFMNCISDLESNLENHRKMNFIGAMLQHHYNSGTKYMSKWIEEKNKRV